MAIEDPFFHRDIDIFSDNQSALHVVRNPRQNSGQYIIAEVVRLINIRREQGLETNFYWIPAHQDDPEFDGNHQADTLAKAATGWDAERKTIYGEKAPPLPECLSRILQAALDLRSRHESKQEWSLE